MAGSRLGGALEVLWVFLRLGLTSFGGPVAHLGYFHAEFVQRRRWLAEQDYADLVALCQFLPGPASSQFGIAVGLGRAGWLGALACEHIMDISSRLVVNQASLKVKRDILQPIIDAFAEAVDQ